VIGFTIAPEVGALGVSGAYVAIIGLANRQTDDSFDAYRTAALAEVRERYAAPGFTQSDPVLAGFRDLHSRVGRSNRRFVASPEALIARFIKSGTLPRVNLLVDIYNLVSLQTRLALGAHDLANIDGDVALRLTDGSEHFQPLGALEAEPIFAGEYGYIDAANDVLCRMEVLQVEKTKVTEQTAGAFYIVQGNANTSAAVLVAALDDLIALTQRYCGGEVHLLYTPS